MWDKNLKIQCFTIRHLQNLKTLSADVLSKYELHTPLPRCDWLMQLIPLSETVCWRAYQLHFGTILSSKLSIGFENGSIEVHEHDLVTAQDG